MVNRRLGIVALLAFFASGTTFRGGGSPGVFRG